MSTGGETHDRSTLGSSVLGFSSGAVVRAAERLLAGPHAGTTVVVVLADSGMKYLSTDLWRTGES